MSNLDQPPVADSLASTAPTEATQAAITDVVHCAPALAHPEHTLGAPRAREYEQHELSALFPRMDQVDFQQLVESILADGLLDEITLCNNMIIDGFHRDEACYITGVPPRYLTLDPKADKLKFVLKKNLRRRQLTASQTGLLMAKIADIENGGSRHGAGRQKTSDSDKNNQSLKLDSDSFASSGMFEPSSTEAPVVTDQSKESGEVAPAKAGVSLADAARLGGVSRATVAVAKKLINEGNDNLLNAVMQHGMSNGHALSLSKLPVDDQIEAIHAFVEGKQEGEKRVKRKATEKKAVEKSKKDHAGIDVTCVVPGESPILTIARVNNGLDWAINYFKAEIPNEEMQGRYDKLLARAKALIDNDPKVKKVRLVF